MHAQDSMHYVRTASTTSFLNASAMSLPNEAWVDTSALEESSEASKKWPARRQHEVRLLEHAPNALLMRNSLRSAAAHIWCKRPNMASRSPSSQLHTARCKSQTGGRPA